MNYLKLYGGTIGAAIVVPAALIAIVGTTMASAFDSSPGGFKLEIVLSALTLVLAISAPALTVLNHARPENSMRKLSAALVAAAGLIATATMAYTLKHNFSLAQVVVLLGALALLGSGVLQVKE